MVVQAGEDPTVDELRPEPAEELKSLRSEVKALRTRIDALEAASKPKPAARKPAAKRASIAKPRRTAATKPPAEGS